MLPDDGKDELSDCSEEEELSKLRAVKRGNWKEESDKVKEDGELEDNERLKIDDDSEEMGEELRPESDELDRKLLGEYVDELDDSIFELIVDDEELIELDDSSH